MVKSMTGYGKGEISLPGRKITAEVRSLNGKQLDLSLRLPSQYRQWEYEIRNAVARSLSRGKVELVVTLETAEQPCGAGMGEAGAENGTERVEPSVASSPTGAGSSREAWCRAAEGGNSAALGPRLADRSAQPAIATGAAINRDYFRDYYRQLVELGDEMGLDAHAPGAAPGLFAAILRLPDVVRSEAAQGSDEERRGVMAAIAVALDAINAFRATEGAALVADLLQRIDIIMSLLGGIAPFEEARADAIRSRIREQIEAMRLTVDENRLEQEMIYYIEKIDITEEKVRLANHCDYFRAVADGEQDAGRKLGFIAQEMGREINTLGSKAGQVDMQKAVVEMKDQLERIKEQVLNIL